MKLTPSAVISEVLDHDKLARFLKKQARKHVKAMMKPVIMLPTNRPTNQLSVPHKELLELASILTSESANRASDSGFNIICPRSIRRIKNTVHPIVKGKTASVQA